MFLIHVSDDGDVEVKQAENAPMWNQDIALDSVEDVARELKDYGCSEEDIAEALNEVSLTNDWVAV
jgi:hypothetical protein